MALQIVMLFLCRCVAVDYIAHALLDRGSRFDQTLSGSHKNLFSFFRTHSFIFSQQLQLP